MLRDILRRGGLGRLAGCMVRLETFTRDLWTFSFPGANGWAGSWYSGPPSRKSSFEKRHRIAEDERKEEDQDDLPNSEVGNSICHCRSRIVGPLEVGELERRTVGSKVICCGIIRNDDLLRYFVCMVTVRFA